ncbi:MAG: TVP38/TMEM64 family protein [Hyphomicrobiaceae bacterium]
MSRLVIVFLGLALLVILPFLFWGGDFERALSTQAAAAWLQSFEGWAWCAGIILLIADLVLPIPGTAIMSALGLVYGTVVGGTIGLFGSIAAGVVGYGLCRVLGRTVASRILGAEGLAKGERLFRTTGGWIVVLSRWLPVFPEVVACMAGLTRMPAGVFLLALVCGSLPLSFVFAAIGAAGLERPSWAIVVSAITPPLIWIAVRPWFAKLIDDNRAA